MASIGRLAPRPPWQPKMIGDIEKGPGGRVDDGYWNDGESRCSAGGGFQLVEAGQRLKRPRIAEIEERKWLMLPWVQGLERPFRAHVEVPRATSQP